MQTTHLSKRLFSREIEMRHVCLLRPVNTRPSLTRKTRMSAWLGRRTGYSFWDSVTHPTCGDSLHLGHPPACPSHRILQAAEHPYPLRPWPPICITYRLSHQAPSLFVWRPTHATYSPQRSPISLSTTASPRTWIVIPPLPTSHLPISTSSVTFPTLTTYTEL